MKDDFGVTTTIGDSSFFNEVCYTGGIYDVSTGLYYLNVRYYDPRNGRFITQDTYRGEVNNPSTLHLYAYCDNNPINYIDPSGHYSQAIKEPTGIRIIRGLVNSVLIGAAIIYNGVTWVKATVAKTSKKYTYYKAMIKDYQVYMSDGISKSAAISRLKKNQDVWTKKKYNAFTIAKAATDKGATVKGPECHLKNKNGKQIPRFYYHYHARYLSSNRV